MTLKSLMQNFFKFLNACVYDAWVYSFLPGKFRHRRAALPELAQIQTCALATPR